MKYRVVVHVLMEQIYEVEAENEKAAIGATCFTTPIDENEIGTAETMSVSPAVSASAEGAKS